MKRGFIRCLWGNEAEKLYRRRNKVVLGDIEFTKYNRFEQPFMIYVFGENNYSVLKDNGFNNCKLLSKEPTLWDCKKNDIQQYGHKLKVLQEASNDFDEFIFLDWDTLPIKPLPDDFWDILGKREAVQAHLRRYSNKVKWIQKRGAIWRSENQNVRPCASFIYIRGKEMANKIYNLWEQNKSWADEKTLASITDDIMGGWQGLQKYWDMFEPYCFTLYRDAGQCICYPKKLLQTKDIYFLHINKVFVSYGLKAIKNITGFEEKQNVIGNILANRVAANLKSIGK